MRPVLSVKNLSVKRGKRTVLQGISFDLFDSTGVVGLFGPNGAGKTTLLHSLAEQLSIQEGKISTKLGNTPVLLPDNNIIYNQLKIRESIRLFQEYFSDFSVEIAQEIIDSLKLNLELKISELSKGMKEQLNLGLMLARRNHVYLFDELLAAVDPLTRDYLLTLIKKFRPDDSVVVISTHLIQGLEQLFDHCLIMYDGRIILSSPTEELVEKGGLEPVVKDILAHV